MTYGLEAPQAPLAWNSPGKIAGVGGRFVLQCTFPTQGSNPCLLHLLCCRRVLPPASPIPFLHPEIGSGMNGTGNCECGVFLPSLCCCRYSVRLTVFNAPSDSRNYILVSSAPESAAAHTVMDLPWLRSVFSVCLLTNSSGREQTFVCPRNTPLCLSQGSRQPVQGASFWSLCSCRSPLCWHSCEEQLPSACYVILLMPSAFIRSQERVNSHRLKRKEDLRFPSSSLGSFILKIARLTLPLRNIVVVWEK